MTNPPSYENNIAINVVIVCFPSVFQLTDEDYYSSGHCLGFYASLVIGGYSSSFA
jgi:hypothetical protein